MGAVGLEPTETEVEGFTVPFAEHTRANRNTQEQEHQPHGLCDLLFY